MKKNQDSSDEYDEEVKVPLYLGITLHQDAKLMIKMRDMIPNAIKKLLDNGYGQVIQDTV